MNIVFTLVVVLQFSVLDQLLAQILRGYAAGRDQVVIRRVEDKELMTDIIILECHCPLGKRLQGFFILANRVQQPWK